MRLSVWGSGSAGQDLPPKLNFKPAHKSSESAPATSWAYRCSLAAPGQPYLMLCVAVGQWGSVPPGEQAWGPASCQLLGLTWLPQVEAPLSEKPRFKPSSASSQTGQLRSASDFSESQFG